MLQSFRITFGHCLRMHMFPQFWMCPSGCIPVTMVDMYGSACSIRTVQLNLPRCFFFQHISTLCYFFGVRYCLVGQGGWEKKTFKDIRTYYWPTIHLALNSSWCPHSVVRCKALLRDSRSSSSGFSRCFVLAFAMWTALKIPYTILYS